MISCIDTIYTRVTYTKTLATLLVSPKVRYFPHLKRKPLLYGKYITKCSVYKKRRKNVWRIIGRNCNMHYLCFLRPNVLPFFRYLPSIKYNEHT